MIDPGPSTRRLDLLPTAPALERLSQALAMLDAIIEPEWDFRYYSFNRKWGPGARMASMRDGEGDTYFIHFDDNGVFLKGLGHESAMAGPTPWPGVLQDIPSELSGPAHEPAFEMDFTTFAIWRLPTWDDWRMGPVAFPEGPDPDGSSTLLQILDGKPETYAAWASAYYDREIDIDAVRAIYAHQALDETLVRRLNETIERADLTADLDEIGYPLAPAW